MKSTRTKSEIVETRLAVREDVPAITAIANWYALNAVANFAVIPEPLDLWLDAWESQHEKLPWLVALRPDNSKRTQTVAQTGNIIGFAKASPFRARCAYAWAVEVSVYLDSAFVGQRIGHMLYDQILNTVRKLGYCTAMAGITLPNAASVRLHESLGFQQIALFKRVGWKFDQWHDVGYWQLDLREPAQSQQPPGPIKTMSDLC